VLERAFALIAGEGGAPGWFDPYVDAGRRTAAARESGQPLAVALNAAVPPRAGARTLRFVPQAHLPEGEAYEAFIARTDQVPTRDHPHDLLNALVWSRFPALKSHLNQRQSDEITRLGVGPRRGPVRDALTLFDENAAWLQAPAALVDALRQHDWHTAFGTMRAAWRESRLTLFGHALMEKLLLSPHKSITAHVWVVPEAVDAETHLVEALTPERLARKADFPLPLAGVPGWCAENESADFYDDTSVFRPKRR
jgi:hypothetical protein